MSYCRWSTDDFRCDLYVYGDESGGITIHVAANRLDLPDSAYPPPISFHDTEAWLERHKAVMALIADAPRRAIELPHAGESFHLDYAEAAAKVRELIALGYQCDPAVADELEAEGVSP